MAFGRFRKLLRREPTRQELYLQLIRGLNVERGYQTWIELWENYGPARVMPQPSLPLSVLLVCHASGTDHAYWNEVAKSGGPKPIQPPAAGTPLKEALPHALRQASDYLMILHPSDRLAATAAQRLCAALDAAPDASLIFGDEDQVDKEGHRFAPWFKPDFGDDLFLCQNGFGRAVIFRKSVVERLAMPEAETLDDAIYDLALQAIAATGKDALHCPGILVHVAGNPTATPKARALYLSSDKRRAAVERYVATKPSLAGATVEGPDAHGFLRLRHPLPDPLPLVSILIPTRDRKDLLELCIKGLDEATN
jgi:O-antigen biosynthesis protein